MVSPSELTDVSGRPKVSVVVCTYNGAKFIEAQLRSILEQTRPPDEIIISDDVSTDNSVSVARQFLQNQSVVPHWRIIEGEKNLGYVKNFERGCTAANGEILFLSDQDDVWFKDKVATYLNILQAPNSWLVFSDGVVTDEALQPRGQLFSSLGIREAELKKVDAGQTFELCLKLNFATGATFAFKRELLELAVPFPPQNWHHDEWLAFCAASIRKIVLYRKPTFFYRQHNANAVGVPSSQLMEMIRRNIIFRLAQRSFSFKHFRVRQTWTKKLVFGLNQIRGTRFCAEIDSVIKNDVGYVHYLEARANAKNPYDILTTIKYSDYRKFSRTPTLSFFYDLYCSLAVFLQITTRS